jgi:hypothetical protein
MNVLYDRKMGGNDEGGCLNSIVERNDKDVQRCTAAFWKGTTAKFHLKQGNLMDSDRQWLENLAVLSRNWKYSIHPRFFGTLKKPTIQ